MTFSSKFAAALAVSSAIAVVPAVSHALTPELKCETGQLKTVASFASCLLKAEAKAVGDMVTPDFTKCREKYNTKFPKFETNAGPGVCPSEGDLVLVRDHAEEYEAEVALLLAGGDLPSCGDGNLDAGEACDSANLAGETCTSQGFDSGSLACSSECHFDLSGCNCAIPTVDCGDGNIDAGEECDVGNLNGGTCATEGFFNGTLHCGAGCQYDTSDCNAARFEDIGNTVLDHQTGLEWEEKTNSDAVANLANAHDVDNTYTWAAAGSAPSGTLYTDFLVKLNGIVDHPTTTTGSCFESHCDWRVPTVDELKTILDAPCGGGAPCVANAEFLPNRSGRYWTASTRDAAPTGAYFVDFISPTLVASDTKTTSKFARAVRRFTD